MIETIVVLYSHSFHYQLRYEVQGREERFDAKTLVRSLNFRLSFHMIGEYIAIYPIKRVSGKIGYRDSATLNMFRMLNLSWV